MAEVVVFHHALGLTDAVGRFADGLRAAGHTAYTPDLYDGRTFQTIEEGMAYSEELGGPMAIVDRARAAVASLPNEAVYIGFSLGVLSAQALAQTRPGARGAVLCYSAVPLGEWGDNWPAKWPNGVRLQLHMLDGDEDLGIAQQLAATVSGAELFVYPGREHYFAEHDEQAAGLLTERVLDFLAAFVPSGFVVPLALATDQFRLEPLGPQHNDSDYEAWSSSVEHIHKTPGWETSSWPDGRSLDENLGDLEAHADDFEKRTGFTYTVLDPASGDVIGCVYIYPDKTEQHDARVRSWVRASRPELDVPLWRAVSDWLANEWPFERVAYAGR